MSNGIPAPKSARSAVANQYSPEHYEEHESKTDLTPRSYLEWHEPEDVATAKLPLLALND